MSHFDDNCSYEDWETDSDQIDSETEAELYGSVHHTEKFDINLCSIDSLSSQTILCTVAATSFCQNGDTHHSEMSDVSANPKTRSVADSSNVNSNHEEFFISVNTTSDSSDSSSSSSECGETLHKRFKRSSACDPTNSNITNGVVSRKPKPHAVSNNFKQKLDAVSEDSSDDSDNSSSVPVSKRAKRKSSSASIIELSSDSSDSSVILTEPEECDMKTNITEIILSSDAGSDSDVKSASVSDDSMSAHLCNNSLDLEKIANQSQSDLWKVNQEDSNRSVRNSKRYHQAPSLQCMLCLQMGHTANFCTSQKHIKCHICGGGSCRSKKCQRQICPGCLRHGHKSLSCKAKLFSRFCHRCQMTGHSISNCPDSWRRYHLTVDKGDLVKSQIVEQVAPVYCYNCGMKDHFGLFCTVARKGERTWPSVVSYEAPEYPNVNQAVNCSKNGNEMNKKSKMTSKKKEKAIKALKKSVAALKCKAARNQHATTSSHTGSSSTSNAQKNSAKKQGMSSTPNTGKMTLKQKEKAIKALRESAEALQRKAALKRKAAWKLQTMTSSHTDSSNISNAQKNSAKKQKKKKKRNLNAANPQANNSAQNIKENVQGGPSTSNTQGKKKSTKKKKNSRAITAAWFDTSPNAWLY